jgi:hypothetical protein
MRGFERMKRDIMASVCRGRPFSLTMLAAPSTAINENNPAVPRAVAGCHHAPKDVAKVVPAIAMLHTKTNSER